MNTSSVVFFMIYFENKPRCLCFNDKLKHWIGQKFVGPPSFNTTWGKTLWMWSIYLAQSTAVKFSQKSLIPLTSSTFVFGLTFRFRWSFKVAHTFSIGLRSGLEGGVDMVETPLSLSQSVVDLLLCLASLSCKKIMYVC